MDCIIWIAGAGTDLASTQYALSHGGVEANPLMGQSIQQQALVKAATTAAGCLGTSYLKKKGKKKLAKALTWGVFALHVGLAASNFRKVK